MRADAIAGVIAGLESRIADLQSRVERLESASAMSWGDRPGPPATGPQKIAVNGRSIHVPDATSTVREILTLAADTGDAAVDHREIDADGDGLGSYVLTLTEDADGQIPVRHEIEALDAPVQVRDGDSWLAVHVGRSAVHARASGG